MEISDHGACIALWRSCVGIGISAADGRDEVLRLLERNPRSCHVALDGELLVGTALSGHDGRRAYLYHLAVAQSHRRRGIARALLDRALDGLRAEGIAKCHLFVYADNHDAKAFYASEGWKKREELELFSLDL